LEKKVPIDINSIWKDMNTTVKETTSISEYYKNSLLSTDIEEEGKMSKFEFAGI
jgi:hypothetical protein